MNNKKGGKFFDKQLHTTMPILQSTEHSPSWENLLANASILGIVTLQHKVKPLPHALMAISMKGLLLASSFLTPVFATTTSQPIPSGSQLSCQQAINRTTGWLVEKKAFIPSQQIQGPVVFSLGLRLRMATMPRYIAAFHQAGRRRLSFIFQEMRIRSGKEHWGPPRLLHPLLQ